MTSLEPSQRPTHTSRKAEGRRISRKSEQTRQQIRDSAARLFAQKGYGLTLLSEIAADAGLHLTALYYYYDNKEQLVSDVLGQVPRQFAGVLRDALDALPPGASHRSRIRAAINAYLGSILQFSDYLRAYARLIAQVSPEIREGVLALTRQDSLVWSTLFEDAARDGAIRADLDLRLVRMTLLGSMNWSAEWFRPGLQSVETFAHTLETMLFDGVAPSRKPRRPAALPATRVTSSPA